MACMMTLLYCIFTTTRMFQFIDFLYKLRLLFFKAQRDLQLEIRKQKLNEFWLLYSNVVIVKMACSAAKKIQNTANFKHEISLQ